MSRSIRNTALAILILPITLGGFLVPQSARAIATPGLPTFDAANLDLNIAIEGTLGAIAGLEGEQVTKDSVLDAIAWQMANLVISSISQSIVNWINSGFEGSPAFVSDLTQNLAGLADAVAAEFIGQLADQVANTPMRGVVEAVAYGYYLSTNGDAYLQKQLYNLRDTVQNDTAFVHDGDFNQGGWRGWFALTGNRANNPHGALLNAKEALNRRIESALDERIKEIGWGGGFLSLRGGKCKKDTAAAGSGGPSLGDVGECIGGQIQTPGSVIQSQLNSSLGLSQQKLVVADEINEILGALVSQLTLQAIQGLSGVGSVSSGGSGFLDQVAAETGGLVGGPGGIDDLLLSGVEGQLNAITRYQAAWQSIGVAADAALACTRTTGTDKTTAEDAKQRATAATLRSSGALVSLQQIVDGIRSAAELTSRTEKVARMQQIALDFQTVSRSAAVPSSVEIVEAEAAAATSTPTGADPSLYMELIRMKNACVPTS